MSARVEARAAWEAALAERNRLDRKLCAQWAWFDVHPGHPETEAKTEIFVRTIARYERVCDEIDAARKVLWCLSR